MIPARALRPAFPRSGPGYPYAPAPIGPGRPDLLSVVVVHHRGAEDLIACLRSVFEADFPRCVEVVVVDLDAGLEVGLELVLQRDECELRLAVALAGVPQRVQPEREQDGDDDDPALEGEGSERAVSALLLGHGATRMGGPSSTLRQARAKEQQAGRCDERMSC